MRSHLDRTSALVLAVVPAPLDDRRRQRAGFVGSVSGAERRGGLDKVGHFLLLGTLSLFAVAFFGRARWVGVVRARRVLSALEEASQAWFPARTVDVWDPGANLTGIVLGGLSATWLTRAARL